MLDDKYSYIYNKVKDCMEQDKLFLQADISLKSLSRIVGTNTVYLSKVINEEFGCSFTEFINGYRIGFVMQHANDTSYPDLEKLAKAAGFGSRSTFYEVFRRRTGMTPRKYAERSKRNRAKQYQAPGTKDNS